MDAASNQATNSNSKLKAYLSVLASSLFFFFLFLQINMYNALDTSLIAAFHLSTTQLGNLSACYYYATVIFLIPAGLILDRFSTRALIICCMAITILMTLLFSMTNSYAVACLSRLVTGICGAFGLLSCIRIAARWFKSDKLAFIIGIVVTIAMTGGICAQTPFTILVDHVAWRHALQADAVIGAFLLALIFLGVYDAPGKKYLKPDATAGQHGIVKSLFTVARNKQNWLAGCYTMLMNLPIMVLGAIWGGAYLIKMDHLSRGLASSVTMMLFLGTIIGSPIFGYLSDHMGKRTPLMRYGAVITLALFVWLIYMPQHSYPVLLGIFLAIGFFTSSQVLSYPLVAESNPAQLLGAAQGLNSMLIMLSGVFQPVFGAILRFHNLQHFTGLQQIPSHSYQNAMLMFILACLVSFVLAAIAREGSNYRENLS